MTRLPNSDASRATARFGVFGLICVCAVTALIVAGMDSAPGFHAGRRPDSLPMLLLPFALTYATAFAVCLVAWVVLALVTRAKDSSRRCAAALGASALSLVGGACAVRVLLMGSRSRPTVALWAVGALLLGSLAARLAYSWALKNDVGLRVTRSVPFRIAGALCLLAGILCAIAGAATRGAPRLPPPGPPLAASRPPRIILISADTLRRDHVSCYANAATATPHLERLCRDSVVFDAARVASPWTLPTFASIMTGVSPLVHRATRTTSMVPAALPRLAQVLEESGYRTRAVVANNFLRPERKLSQGFQDYTFFLPRWNLASAAGRRVWARLFPELLPVDGSTDDLTDTALRILQEDRDVPLFLWLHYLDPHMPYTPPQRYLDGTQAPPTMPNFFAKRKGEEIRAGFLVPDQRERAWIRTLYAAEVRYVDDNVGRVLDTLRRLGLYDDSLIVFTSDHGEEFWEHGGFEHGHTLYDELLRVPLIVKPPQSHASKRVDLPVPSQDLAATILDVAGIRNAAFPTAASLQRFWQPFADRSGNFLPLATGPAFYEDRVAVVFDGYKFIRWRISGHEELYQLQGDPREQQSLAAAAPDVLSRARRLIQDAEADAARVRERCGLTEAGETATVDAATREQLRQLGYER